MKSILTLSLFALFSFFAAVTVIAEEFTPPDKSNPNIKISLGESAPNAPHVVYHSIAGHVHKEVGGHFEGVTITFSGGIDPVTTDSMGFYSVEVPNGWTGVATPSYCGFHTFSPEEMFYINVKKDYSDQDYTGAPGQMFTISGQFTDYYTGGPISNTEIELGNNISVSTNDQGEYSIEALPCTSITLEPHLEGYNFDPGYLVYSFTNTNYIDQDFEGTPNWYGIPPGWEHNNTGKVHVISILTSSNPNLCGIPLGQGDYIGVFYTDDEGGLRCGGFGIWNGISNTAIIAQGDDDMTPEKDGFDYGEEFTWKVYRWNGDQKECTATPEFQCGGLLTCNNKWYITALSIIEELNIYDGQYIEIPEGWSGFSSFIVPQSPLVTHTMSPIIDDLIVMLSLTKIYYPGLGINTIGLWDTHYGFKIKVGSDVVLPIVGCPEEDTQINLQTTWNIVPVLSSCNVQIAEFLEPVIDNIIVVKEIAGNKIFWPELNIATLQTLLPGKAYMAAVSQNSLVSYPGCSGNLKSGNYNTKGMENLTHWNDPALTALNHNIAMRADALQKIETGDFIGAFTREGYCAGLTQITNINENQVITIFGDDNTTPEKDGFMQDEYISFKLYRPAEDKEYNLSVEYDQYISAINGIFTDNGLSAINEILFDPTNISGITEGKINIFPNPGTGIFEINVPDISNLYHVNIYGMTGNTVFDADVEGNTKINLNDLPKGIYIIKIETGGFIRYEKLILE